VYVRSLVNLSLLVPKSALISGQRTQIPRLDQEPLGAIDIVLILQLLHAHLHAILCEDDVVGVHLIRGGVGDLLEGDVEVIGDEGRARQNCEEEEEGEEFAGILISRECRLESQDLEFRG
jgi:hypothetical protein